MAGTDITKAPRDALCEITGVRWDQNASQAERIMGFLRQVRNPYAFRVGEVAVKIEHLPGGRLLAEAIEAYLTAIRF